MKIQYRFILTIILFIIEYLPYRSLSWKSCGAVRTAALRAGVRSETAAKARTALGKCWRPQLRPRPPRRTTVAVGGSVGRPRTARRTRSRGRRACDAAVAAAAVAATADTPAADTERGRSTSSVAVAVAAAAATANPKRPEANTTGAAARRPSDVCGRRRRRFRW